MFRLPCLFCQTLFLVPGQAPSSTLSSGAKPFDCRPFGALAFHVASAAGSPVVLQIDVRDAAGAVSKATFKLRPHGDAAVAIPLNSPDPLEMGMRGDPAIPGYRLASSDHHRIDTSRVASIALRLPSAATAAQLHIDDVKLIPGVTYDKIVDPLGQFARDDWPGKTKNETELTTRRAAEEAAIAANPRLPERDEYGGWSAGPELPASGFFRSTKRDGKWWLVTPKAASKCFSGCRPKTIRSPAITAKTAIGKRWGSRSSTTWAGPSTSIPPTWSANTAKTGMRRGRRRPSRGCPRGA
jgi:hypothetical protein